RRTIQGVNFKEVAVGRTARRRRAAVADLFKVIATLFRAAWERLDLGHTFRKRSRVGWHPPQYPMYPGADRGIRVVADQGDRFRSSRRLAPRDRWRHIRSVCRMLLGNRLPVCERRTLDFESHGLASFRTMRSRR